MLPSNENSLKTPFVLARATEADAPISEMVDGLRIAEEIALAFLVYMTVACFELPLLVREQVTITALNVVAGAVIFLLLKVTKEHPLGFLVVVRDWFPAVLILLAYRESGLFFIPDPTHRLDYVFVRWDSVLLHNRWVLAALSVLAPWLQYYLELAYLLCYPIVPLGLGCLLAFKSKIVVDHFWTAVLTATLFCYSVYPFFPLIPPRLLFHDLPGPVVPLFLRTANLVLLRSYGVQACIFPSGHVAAVTAVAFAVRAHRLRLAPLFLAAATSVAVATVFLRYHYAADAVAGALVGWGASRISAAIHREQEWP